MIDLRPRDLFDAGFRRWIEQALGRRPLLLVGSVGAGAGDLAWSAVEQAKIPILLRPTVGASRGELIASVVSQLLHRTDPSGAAAFEGDSAGARRARLELARRFGPDVFLALDAAKGEVPETWTLTDATGAHTNISESTPALHVVVTNAHRAPEAAMWELRDLANVGRIVLVATTHQEHLGAHFGADSPLFGNYTVAEVPTVDAQMWTRRIPEEVLPSDAEFLQGRTRGRASSTVDVLSFLKPGYTVRYAWSRAVEARKHEAENILNLATGVHSYAPRLLMAIARRQAPYGAIRGAPSQRVARALAKLRETDLIERPAPRTWQIADPVLQGALLGQASEVLTGAAASARFD